MKNWISCDIGGVVVTVFTIHTKRSRIIRHKKAWSKNNSTQWKRNNNFCFSERLQQHTMEKETTISSSSRTITTAHNGKRNNNFLFFPNDYNSTQWKKKQQFPLLPERLQQHTMEKETTISSRTITTVHNGKRNNNFLFFPNDYNSTQCGFRPQLFPSFPSYDVPLLRVINNHAGWEG